MPTRATKITDMIAMGHFSPHYYPRHSIDELYRASEAVEKAIEHDSSIEPGSAAYLNLCARALDGAARPDGPLTLPRTPSSFIAVLLLAGCVIEVAAADTGTSESPGVVMTMTEASGSTSSTASGGSSSSTGSSSGVSSDDGTETPETPETVETSVESDDDPCIYDCYLDQSLEVAAWCDTKFSLELEDREFCREMMLEGVRMRCREACGCPNSKWEC